MSVHELPSKSPKANNKEAVERVLKIRRGHPEWSPEDLFEHLSKKFINNFSTWNSLNDLPVDAIPQLRQFSRTSSKSKNPIYSAKKGAKDSIKSIGFDRAGNALKKYVLTVALLYGENPSSPDAAFRQILGSEFDKFLRDGKNIRSNNKRLSIEFIALVGLVPQLKRYKNRIQAAVLLADGFISFFRSREDQKEFAQDFVVMVKDCLGDPPQDFPPLLRLDDDNSEVEKRSPRLRVMVNQAGLFIQEHSPGKLIDQEQRMERKQKHIYRKIEKLYQKAEKISLKGESKPNGSVD